MSCGGGGGGKRQQVDGPAHQGPRGAEGLFDDEARVTDDASVTPASASAVDDAHCAPTLFLDVDGVLNTASMPGARSLHPKLLQRLVQLVRETGARIVLSTSWRLHTGYKQTLIARLEDAGLDTDMHVIGCTPRLAPTRAFNPLAEGQRCAEILSWLHLHRRNSPALVWAAVDDLDLELPVDMREAFKDHFCRTQPEAGLSEACCQQLRLMLSRAAPEETVPCS